MIQFWQQPAPGSIVYPESDGLPMAENSVQFRLIVMLYSNLAALFWDAANVFVVGDMFWYPVEGEPEIRLAPDVMVIFGRPKGDRPSYRQWDEENVPVQVVFEILSPANDIEEMTDKAIFYGEYGVEEYYIYDPEKHHLSIYHRRGAVLRRVYKISEWVSPRMGIRFDVSGPELVVYRPDGQRFRTFEEIQIALAKQQEAARDALQRLDEAKKHTDEAEKRADEAKKHADAAREQSNQATRNMVRLAELGRKARQGQASPEELAELEHLEELAERERLTEPPGLMP